jgi:hypothetical protein
MHQKKKYGLYCLMMPLTGFGPLLFLLFLMPKQTGKQAAGRFSKMEMVMDL